MIKNDSSKLFKKMENFSPNKFLIDLRSSNLSKIAKERCEKLRMSMTCMAPELIPTAFFNGLGEKPGIRAILTEHASDDDELKKDMQARYLVILESYREYARAEMNDG